MSTRISARIEDKLARELADLKKRHGMTLSEIIGEALREWTRAHSAKRSPAEIFAATGFIGSGTGPRDLGRNSKKYLLRIEDE